MDNCRALRDMRVVGPGGAGETGDRGGDFPSHSASDARSQTAPPAVQSLGSDLLPLLLAAYCLLVFLLCFWALRTSVGCSLVIDGASFAPRS